MSPVSFITPRKLGRVPQEMVTPLPVNRILHGDCIHLMQGLPDESVDLILTDPPYLCRYVDRDGRTVANDDNDAWLAPAAEQMFRVLKPDSLMVSFYGWHVVDRFMAAWRAAGFRPVAHLVFAKDYASSRRFFRHQHEQAYVLAKGRPPLPARPTSDIRGWDYTGNRSHPTQKPLKALTPLIEELCPTGGLVLDPFCGSASSLVAARHCGRDFIGMELDDRHCATARHRLKLP